MFDLNEAIGEWRRDMAARELGDERGVEELESHLCEEVENLAESGLSEEEAFWVATRRLGDNGGLAREFRKVHATEVWMRRVPWMGAGILTYLVVVKTSNVAGMLASSLGASVLGLDGLWLSCLSFVISAFAILAVCAAGVLLVSLAGKGDAPFAGRRSQPWAVFPILLLLIYALQATTIFAHALLARAVGLEVFGRIAIARSYAGVAWGALIPAIVAVLSAAILLRRRRRVGA